MRKLIVDGYNLLFALSQEDKPLEKEREAIISALTCYAERQATRLMLVFDAHKQQDPFSRIPYQSIEIIYTEHRQTADQYILEYIESSQSSMKYTVVTADRELIRLVHHLGAETLSLKKFIRQIKAATHASQEEEKTTSFLPSLKGEPYPGYFYYLKIFEQRVQDLKNKKDS